jgi:XTP/dITP diphosphohydrolase
MTCRRFTEPRLVIASHNEGKVREIGALLAPYAIEVISAGALGLDEPEETGTTFAENAALKAKAAAKAANLPALADDSGLAVTALGGDPGIYSARWAGPEKDFDLAMQKVEDALAGQGDRSAAFICALALCWPDSDPNGGHMEIFEGRVEGDLIWPARGDRGFGYDPVFVPTGGSFSFGEMEPDAKHAISHRADAFAKLNAACFDGN